MKKNKVETSALDINIEKANVVNEIKDKKIVLNEWHSVEYLKKKYKADEGKSVFILPDGKELVL